MLKILLASGNFSGEKAQFQISWTGTVSYTFLPQVLTETAGRQTDYLPWMQPSSLSDSESNSLLVIVDATDFVSSSETTFFWSCPFVNFSFFDCELFLAVLSETTVFKSIDLGKYFSKDKGYITLN